MERLEAKLDKIQEDISEIKKNVAVNTSDLSHHIARTNLLEKKVESIPAKVLVFLSLLSGLLTVAKMLN
jgi:hypothetical protein